jgi:hypothetical protein
MLKPSAVAASSEYWFSRTVWNVRITDYMIHGPIVDVVEQTLDDSVAVFDHGSFQSCR